MDFRALRGSATGLDGRPPAPGDRGADEDNGEHESPPSGLSKREASSFNRILRPFLSSRTPVSASPSTATLPNDRRVRRREPARASTNASTVMGAKASFRA